MSSSIPSMFRRKDFSASAVTMSTLRMPAIRPTTRNGSASRAWFLMVRRTLWSSSATMNSTSPLSRAERTTVFSPYGPWIDLMTSWTTPTAGAQQQYEKRRDDEVDAVLDELQKALHPAALDLRKNGSHSQHAGVPRPAGPQA